MSRRSGGNSGRGKKNFRGVLSGLEFPRVAPSGLEYT